MPNHVIRDRIWESGKLAKCSMSAALAYPWIFLVADAWGRFEYSPRRIWTKVFGNREDVSLADVSAWLTEYESVGLLFRYHINNELAVWVGFYGRQTSKRHPSQYPDPEPFMKRASKSGRTKVSKVRPRKSGRTLDAMDRELDRDRELERERENGATAAAVVAVPVPWSREAIDDHRELKGHLGKSEGRIPAALKPLVDEYGWPRVRPPWRKWLQSEDARYGVEWFAGNFLRIEGGGSRASPNPKAQERLRGFNAMIGGGLKGAGRNVGAGDEGAGGELPGQGSARIGVGDAGGDLPPGATGTHG